MKHTLKAIHIILTYIRAILELDDNLSIIIFADNTVSAGELP